MSNNYQTLDDLPERTADRIIFMAELIWEVIPQEKNRAKKRAIVAENAENYYMRQRQRFLDDPSNTVLTLTKSGDSWVRATFVNTYWSDIRDYLAITGRAIAWNQNGVYRTQNVDTVIDIHELQAQAIKKQSERLTYRAILFNKATHAGLPGIVTQILSLGDGGTIS